MRFQSSLTEIFFCRTDLNCFPIQYISFLTPRRSCNSLWLYVEFLFPNSFPAYIANIVALDTKSAGPCVQSLLAPNIRPAGNSHSRSFRTVLPHPSSNHWLRSLSLSRCPRKRNLIKKISQTKFMKIRKRKPKLMALQADWNCVLFFCH